MNTIFIVIILKNRQPVNMASLSIYRTLQIIPHLQSRLQNHLHRSHHLQNRLQNRLQNHQDNQE